MIGENKSTSLLFPVGCVIELFLAQHFGGTVLLLLCTQPPNSLTPASTGTFGTPGPWHCLLPATCLLDVTRVCKLMWRFEYINNSWDKSKDEFPELTRGKTLALGSIGVLSMTHVLVQDKVKMKVPLGSPLVRLSPWGTFDIADEISLLT